MIVQLYLIAVLLTQMRNWSMYVTTIIRWNGECEIREEDTGNREASLKTVAKVKDLSEENQKGVSGRRTRKS